MRNPLITLIGGNFKTRKKSAKWSPKAQQLIADASDGLETFYDYHMHLLGLGTKERDIWVNPTVLSLIHPFDFLKAKVFMNASGIRNKKKADEQYLNQLFQLIEKIPIAGKYCLFAWEKCYDLNGEVNLKDTKIHISNDYVFRICQRLPDKLVPVVSIHPYRTDAVIELEKWAKKGVKMVKWMPATMGMDPSEPRCVPFYQKMKDLDMVLISHAGEEETVPVEKFQPLNNPLLFRLPLEIGTKVILAHCAGKGDGKDLENKGKKVPNHELFFRMMDEPRYEGKLFGDISALAQANRCGAPLRTVFEQKEHHHKLLYGSDYPLPAINSAISLKLLIKLGYLNKEDKSPLTEIYKNNPLLFSFVLFRSMHDPNDENYRLPISVFSYHKSLGI
ncbi:amidohydrolase family protein [Litoribacter populi]|uniref:amidohydrolase family protein n=1 Tax=Litoribacter populi TaxID=2598460 RepID=UPI0011810D1C|nr:amidohydrolase family protein [Litoribacter populi]